MQIGSCWFEQSQATLLNQDNDTCWSMPSAEFAVLELLAAHRGQVLSNADLIACLPEEEASMTRLIQAIDRIRFFLGGSSAKLIESINNQGFILHVKLANSSGLTSGIPAKSMTKQQYMLLIAQLLLLFLLIYSVFEPSTDLSSISDALDVSRPS